MCTYQFLANWLSLLPLYYLTHSFFSVVLLLLLLFRYVTRIVFFFFLFYDMIMRGIVYLFISLLYYTDTHLFVCLLRFRTFFSFCHTLFAYFAGLRIFRYSHRLPVFIDLIWRISFLALAPPFWRFIFLLVGIDASLAAALLYPHTHTLCVVVVVVFVVRIHFSFTPSSGNTIQPAVLFPTFSFEDYVGYISSVAIIMTMRRRRRRRGSVGRKIGGKKTSIDALRLVALAGTHTHTH